MNEFNSEYLCKPYDEREELRKENSRLSFFLERIQSRLRELENELRIGDEVTIAQGNKYYFDWVGVKGKVIGIDLLTSGKVGYTITDGTGTGCDGWYREDLVKVVLDGHDVKG